MINRDEIMEMLGCDDEFLEKLFEQFVIECNVSVKKINEAYINNEWQIVRGASHKILSSTKILTLNKLTTILQEIEIIAESKNNTEKMPSLLVALNSEIQLIQDELKTQKQNK